MSSPQTSTFAMAWVFMCSHIYTYVYTLNRFNEEKQNFILVFASKLQFTLSALLLFPSPASSCLPNNYFFSVSVKKGTEFP